MNYAINVDWLQVFCHDHNAQALTVYNCGDTDFQFVKLEHSSRHFKQVWEVFNCDGDKYAVVQCHPFSSILSADAAIVQLCNRELYRIDFARHFLQFLIDHRFTYKSISRLDVCFDSVVLYRGLTHANLIKGLMLGNILKNNQARVKWHFDSMASVARPMECNSASFGSLSSAVSSKIYNKSLELREVKNKPYIVECWRMNDIPCDEIDVWRIELSIKSDAATSVVTETGEILRLDIEQLYFQEKTESIFFNYAAKYFSFKKNNGTKNKSRMPDLVIFPPDRKPTARPVRITTAVDSSRSDKIFLKKLHNLATELRSIDAATEKAIWEVSDAVTFKKALGNWREGKIPTPEGLEYPYSMGHLRLNFLKRLDDLKKDVIELYPNRKSNIVPLIEYIEKSLNTK